MRAWAIACLAPWYNNTMRRCGLAPVTAVSTPTRAYALAPACPGENIGAPPVKLTAVRSWHWPCRASPRRHDPYPGYRIGRGKALAQCLDQCKEGSGA